MLKNILLLASLVGQAFSAKTDFPEFDIFHANCAMEVTYPSQTCQQAFTAVEKTIREFNPEPDANGIYALKESADTDYIWTTRTTPVKKYIDDIIFEFKQQGANCIVSSKSRSQTFSIYDYETNYCNIYNVHRYIGGFTNLKTSQCRYEPSDPVERCKIY
ncbi:UNKNOWN [Stylonychia lemnae]|uniref:Uncharacterized protein n=1 Tax=Stylonychia lemnae TaxID=5949 RepID=A0A077ZNN0_STYLE|nr:UNKNOWN [Stylonychia lemnae]|eukprot:CDW71084.1 UNKNOWN [Stylonychia lemnae]